MDAIGTFDGTTLLDALGAMLAVFAIPFFVCCFGHSSPCWNPRHDCGVSGSWWTQADTRPDVDNSSKGSDFINLIGKTLGEFVGSIVGGVLDKVSDSFPALATKLSEFMVNLQPFLDGAKQITKPMTDGIVSLVEVILLITAASVINGLTSWLTGGSSIKTFGKDIASFGKSYAKYYEAVKDIEPDVVTKSADAAKVLTEMANSAPKWGGVWSWFTGENRLETFGDELRRFGKDLKQYSIEVSGAKNRRRNCISYRWVNANGYG